MPGFADVLRALAGAKQTVRQLNEKIAELERQAHAIRARPPHRDDLIAWLERGVDAASAEYLRRLNDWYFAGAGGPRYPSDHYATDASTNLLCVPPIKPIAGEAPTLSGLNDAASCVALTHFLAPVIRAQIPDVVDRCYPDAGSGLKAGERAAQLAKIEAEIAKVTTQRDELLAELEAARGEAG